MKEKNDFQILCIIIAAVTALLHLYRYDLNMGLPKV